MNDLSVYENKILGNNHCWYCGEWLFDGIKSKDHFWPRKRKKGRLIVICCKNCNAMKGNRTPLGFIMFLNRLKKANPYKQNLFPKFDRMINATQTLWDRVKWSIDDNKKTIYERQ